MGVTRLDGGVDFLKQVATEAAQNFVADRAEQNGVNPSVENDGLTPQQLIENRYGFAGTFQRYQLEQSLNIPLVPPFPFPPVPVIPEPLRQIVERIREVAQAAEGQPLTDAQKAELRKVFGNSVDLDQIRIVYGPQELFDAATPFRGGGQTPAFTLGNTIVVNPRFPLTDSLLVHETTHVWQFQSGDGDYAIKALVAQFAGDGYDWRQGVAEGKSWSELNPEQQGELIQNAHEQGFFNQPAGTARFVVDGVDYTDYLNNAVAQLRRNEGLPDWDFSKITDEIRERWNQAVEVASEILERGREFVEDVGEAGRDVLERGQDILEDVGEGVRRVAPWLP